MSQTAWNFRFVINPALMVTNPNAPQGTQGQPYSYQYLVTGGVAPYAFSAVGLPTGLTLSSGGLISGTPTAQGNFDAVITVVDATG